MAVTLTNNSAQVIAKLQQAVANSLQEAGYEVASHANSNVKLQNDAGKKLRGSYDVDVDSVGNRARVGTSLEEGFWEEFGTGSHADTAKNGGVSGRPMWWVYVTNETPRADDPIYLTEEEAHAIAAGLQEQGKDAHASDGYDPNYTLEKAFLAKKATIERIFGNNVRMGL